MKERNIRNGGIAMHNISGITLIALVITIIVLLILAGVSIATLTGSNGILTQAGEAKTETEIEEVKEKARVDIATWVSDKLQKGEDGSLNDAKIKEILTGKDYVKELKETSFISSKGHEINYSDLYDNINGGGEAEGNQTVADLKPTEGESVKTVTKNTIIKDEKGNQVVIPEEFGIAKDSATIVTDGVVIEDVNGNQFVWIPVGRINKNDGTTAEIKLSRYTFAEDGTPTDQDENVIGNYYQELITSSYGNTTAKDIEGFKTSANINHGYYIARYEASKNQGTGKAQSKSEEEVWNNITQQDATTASRDMYTTNNFTNDLMNSYAWDTAILFIQTFSDKKNYSNQNSINRGTVVKTGELFDDVKCHIHDMASNVSEWTTETRMDSNAPCIYRGGNFGASYIPASVRSYFNGVDVFSDYQGFRPLLYL